MLVLKYALKSQKSEKTVNVNYVCCTRRREGCARRRPVSDLQDSSLPPA
ncbi:hypothetical protein A2U01_0109196, partial [Trifolium medium]|nr:hypothetical protein [Trifolium medium]